MMDYAEADKEKEIRQRLKNDFPYYAEKCLKIRTKEGSILPFTLNKAQRFAYEKIRLQLEATGKVRVIALKGRQQGFSTLIEGLYYHQVTHGIGKRAFVLTHALDATNNLFDMISRFHDYCPNYLKPAASKSNSKELVFGAIDSGYKIGTAENKSVGRSQTIQLLHGSEVAYWQNAAEHAKGIMQTVPTSAGTWIVLESTANGIGNYFHQQWQLAETGRSDFINIFLPWYWQPEYSRLLEDDFKLTPIEEEMSELYGITAEQLNWRRYKILELSVSGQDGEKAFCVEYPNNSQEAFQHTGEDTYIEGHLIAKARKTVVDAVGPLVIGVDPARFGDDRSVIVRRRGRKIYDMEIYNKHETMQVVGRVHQIILAESPDRVFVDVGGLGAGVVDRLRELGHGTLIVAVNAGSTPLDSAKYSNKRAEMWGEFKQWLGDEPAQVPDSDELHADACGIRYKIDSNSRLVMERKEDMKKRGLRSPDTADAVILTFAMPIAFGNVTAHKQIARKLTSIDRKLESIRKNRKW